MPHLWLIGMMGSGKTAVGRLLAERLGTAFYDTDAEIERRLGCSIGRFWGSNGEQAFRDIEAAQVASLAQREPAVIATGGGAVLRPGNVEAMRGSGVVVWLEASPPVLAGRVGDDTGRPLLAGEEVPGRIESLLTEREPAYAAAAHERVDTAGRRPDEVADDLARLWTAS